MTGEAIIAELKNLQPIEGADRIVSATIFGETIIVSKDHKEGEIGILFDCETQLSNAFCFHNNLFRHSDLNEDKTKIGYIEDNRRVRALKLKGVRCSGFWLPLSSLAFTGVDIQILKTGAQYTKIEGFDICEKYVAPRTKTAQANRQGKVKADLVPTFKEHVDTDQFMRNQHLLKEGQYVVITEKLHGTSCRVGNLPIALPKLNFWQQLIDFFYGILAFFTFSWDKDSVYDHGHVVGSRRVVKEAGEEIEGKSYYDSNIWSLSAEQFRNKLEKGETVYYEIVGFLPDGGSIMPTQSNDKLKKFMDKDEFKVFKAAYGDTTRFDYGCANLAAYDSDAKSEHKVFVYRITQTNEDGHTVDYSWDQVKMRCEQLDVKHVPELAKILVHKWEEADDRDSYLGDQYGHKIDKMVETLAESNSLSFPDHLREGVCVRIENGGLTPKLLKHKAYLFKVLEGIIKESNVEDIEEAEG